MLSGAFRYGIGDRGRTASRLAVRFSASLVREALWPAIAVVGIGMIGKAHGHHGRPLEKDSAHVVMAYLWHEPHTTEHHRERPTSR